MPDLSSPRHDRDESALPEFTSTLYGVLRRIASRMMSSERPNHTLQVTALVHEAYLKLAGVGKHRFDSQAHFLAVASRVMRQVLVDHARSRGAKKRFGEFRREPSWTASLEVPDSNGLTVVELLELDDALASLAAENESPARLIEMRYFGGMTAEESAEALGMSVHVVRHELRFAQAWLRRRLSRGDRAAS